MPEYLYTFVFRPLIDIDEIVCFRIWAQSRPAAGFYVQGPPLDQTLLERFSDSDSIGEGSAEGEIVVNPASERNAARPNVHAKWVPLMRRVACYGLNRNSPCGNSASGASKRSKSAGGNAESTSIACC